MLFNWKRALSGAMAAGMVVCAAAFPVSATSYPAIGSTKDADPGRIIEHGIKSPYPLKNAPKITYWSVVHANVLPNMKSTVAETAWAQQLMKDTGITVEFQHAATGQESNRFNLMTATRQMPDIIEYKWAADTGYTGGPTAAIKDKVMLDLTPMMKDGSIPYLAAYLKDNPAIERQVKMDDGRYYVFPFIRPAEGSKTTSGPIIRGDWLKDLGLAAPVTIDDWDKMLTAFKDKKGAKAPFAQHTATGATDAGVDGLVNTFGSVFGFRGSGFYVDANGKTVKYAPYTSGWKDFLTQMNKWYKAGLIDKDFLTRTDGQKGTLFMTEQAGASYGGAGGNISSWLPAMKAKDPKVEIIGVNFPVKNKGDKILYTGSDNFYVYDNTGNACITATSKNQKVAAQFLDYAYSPKGYMVYNWGGQKGVTYTEKTPGEYHYTDLIMNNKKGQTVSTKDMPFAEACAWYTRANCNGPFVQDPTYFEDYYSDPAVNAAWKTFGQIDPKAYTTKYPPTTYTAAETASEKALKTDIQTYVKQMTSQFILGTKSIDKEWDAYLAQLKKSNVDQLVRNAQQAYDRYLKR